MEEVKVLTKLEEMKIMPVVSLDRASDAMPLGEALCAGSLPAAEITFRTDAAEEAIRIMRKEFPEMLAGAGTVVNVEQARRALDAGALFLVSPGVNRRVIEFALENKIPVFPGICTPTEIMAAMEYRLPAVKFFPAKQYGGLSAIKAFAAPFPGVRFMPTGGISAANILEYLSFDRVIACGGSWMVKRELIREENFMEITRLTAEAVALISGLKKEAVL